MTAPVSRQQQSAPKPPLVAATEAFVRSHLQGHDASHDWAHVHRVRNNAAKLARQEGVDGEGDLLIIELAALLHDVHDHKYGGSSEQAAQAIQVRARRICTPL